MEESVATVSGWGERTKADVSSLLLELGRALKGQRYYPPDHPALRDIIDRAFLAWQVELERTGSIELRVEDDRVRCNGVAEPQLAEAVLREQLHAHALEVVCARPDVTRQGFAGFVAVLAREPESFHGDFASELARIPASRTGGIEVNRTGASDLEWANDDELELPSAPDASLGSALLTGRSASATAPPPPSNDEKLSIDEAPLRAPATTEDGELLRQCLLRLDGCSSDDDYDRLSGRAFALANDLASSGAADEGHRAMLVFSQHASGQGGRSGSQLRSARATLERYASGARLRELIERASSATGSAGVRAAQVLLQLGQRTVAPLLETLRNISEPERIAQLTAVVVALGERAQPVLRDAIEHGPPACGRIAVQLAGELQSPGLVDILVETLEGNRPELAREAAKALVVIGSDAAVSALTAALSSRCEGLPETAAYCLGSVRRDSVVDPLLAALDRAIRSRRDPLARACIRSLGQLGSDRATPKLAAIVDHTSFLQRKRQRTLKLTALTALSQLPCNEARRAIARARKSRDTAVREHAEKL